MVSRGLQFVQPLIANRALAAFVASVLLTSCSLGGSSLSSVAADRGIDRQALVAIGPDAVAVHIAGGEVQLVMFTQVAGDWVATVINSHKAKAGQNSGHLIAYGGATGAGWNSFFYGTAAEGIASIRVSRADALGGKVINGTWVVALRGKDLTPDDIAWEFLNGTGKPVLSGKGIFPPEA